MPLAGEPAALGVEVAEERPPGAAGDERGRERLQLLPRRRARDHVLLVDEQRQQRRRRALEREPAVLAQAVDGQVEVARAARLALGLGAEDEVLEAAEAEQVLRRFDADAHLVAVVGPRVGEAVDDRADGRAQDQPALGDLPRALMVGLEAVFGWRQVGHGGTR